MKRPPAQQPELLRWLRMQGDADRRILAQLWALPADIDLPALAAALIESERVRAQWERLSEAERAAMTRVLQEGGALPVATVQREWGVVRDPARFANPRAYLDALEAPASPAERLYMMGLLVRDHDDRGPVFRVLHDLRPLLPEVEPRDRTLRVEPVAEPDQIEQASSVAVERTILFLLELAHAGALTTLDDGALNKASLVRLGARIAPGEKLRGIRREVDWPWVALLRSIAVEAGILRRTTDGLLHVGGQAPAWLQSARAERLATLLRAWVTSPINELSLLCGLTWRSLPLDLRLPASRAALLKLIKSLPAGQWLRIADIAAAVEQVEPDFLRRNGRYDTWLLYDYHNRLMAGRESWSQVEGEFVGVVFLAVLRWLGLVDSAGTERLDRVRFSPLGEHLLHGAPPPPEPPAEPLTVQGTFEVVCPPEASLWVRFQLPRIAERVSEDAASVFRLTRRSVLEAVERGITAEAILRFLADNGRGPVPQAVARYVEEWAGEVGHLRLEEAALLRADDPLRLLEARRARGIDLPPVEELTPEIWKVAPGDVQPLLAQLQRAGFSVDGAKDRAAGDGASAKTPLADHDLKALVTAAYAYASLCADYDLPCEVSQAMLGRLAKLVPSRQFTAARHAAEKLSKRVRAENAAAEDVEVEGHA
jgi:hypothetical protein